MTLKEELLAMSIAAGLSGPAAAQPTTPDNTNDTIPNTTVMVSTNQTTAPTDGPTITTVDSGDELAKTRDKIAQKNALNSRVANPLKTSISYKGKDWSIIGDQYQYEIKTKHGIIELSTTQPDPTDGIRGCGTCLSDDFDGLITSLTPKPLKVKSGKLEGWSVYSSIDKAYSSEERAVTEMKRRISEAVEGYLVNEALRIYAEQNKSETTFKMYRSVEFYEKNKQTYIDDLKKLGLIVDAKGNFKRDPNYAKQKREYIAKAKKMGGELEDTEKSSQTTATHTVVVATNSTQIQK